MDLNDRIEAITKHLQKESGKKELLVINQQKRMKESKLLQRESIQIEKAIQIVQVVALETQQQLEYSIADVVSHAEKAVFDDAYEMSVEFIERRGKTECDLMFLKNQNLSAPLTSSGYGAVDIASYALRVACREMSDETPPIFILDEPFKHLKGSVANRRAIEMVKEVSDELELQIITVSDERAAREDIVLGADKVFEVSQIKGVSQMSEV